jgi:hypothetical protein
LVVLTSGVVLLALAWVVISHFNKPQRHFSEVTENLQSSWLHDGQLYYYTGSFFAKYDTSTGSISRLSDYLIIQNGISLPNWTPDAVVFQTNPASGDRDDVTTAAQQLGAKQYQSHWWRYDFQTKQYQLIALPGADTCEEVTQVSSSLLACAAPQSSGSSSMTLKILDLGSGSSRTLFSTDDDISNITSDSRNVYFVVTKLSGVQSLHSVSYSASPVHKELFSGDGQLTYYSYGEGRILIDDASNDTKSAKTGNTAEVSQQPFSAKQKLVLMNGGKTTFTKKIKSLPVSLFSDAAGNALFSSLDGSVSSVSGDGIKVLVKPASPVLKNGDFLFSAGDKLYNLGVNRKLYSSPGTPRGDNSKYPSSFNSVADNDPSGNSFINRLGNGQWNVYMYIPDVSSSQQQLAIGTMLEKKGFKPSEFNFTWVVDGADFNTPVSPNAIIIK